MIRVKFSSIHGCVPIERITPGSKAIIGNVQFFINKEVDQVDWWVVADGMEQRESVICPPENTIFISQETEFVKEYKQKFINQFNWIITSNRKIRHPRKIFRHQGYGSYLFLSRKRPDQSIEDFQKQFKTYDELRAMDYIPKTKLISVIASHKLRTPGAIKRNLFIRKMKEHFGERLDAYSNRPDVFGPDTIVAKLKWDAVAPYKYHIAIENSVVPHYWTDKLLDSYLAGSYPFYYGHPNVSEYFSPKSMTMIDIDDIPGSISIIEKAISENLYESRIADIREAKKLAIDKYNIFSLIAETINGLPASSKEPKKITLIPEQKETLIQKISKITENMPLTHKLGKKLFRKYRTLVHKQNFYD